MISSVSNVNFRGETAVSAQDLINSPGKYSVAPQAKTDVPEDSFEKSEGKKNKSNTGAIIGTAAALLAVAYATLGVMVHKGKLEKIEAPEGFMQKVKNFFYNVGESADNLWGKIRKRNDADVDVKAKPEAEAEVPKKPEVEAEAPKKTEAEVETPKNPETEAPKGGEDGIETVEPEEIPPKD